jgi:maleate isomerase
MRTGLLVPATNTTCEVDLWRALPEGVSLHSHRLWLTDWRDDEASMARMNEDVAHAAEHLMAASVDVIAYGCTSGSFFAGPGHDAEIAGRIGGSGEVPVVVASPATVSALRALDAGRVSVATPYPPWIAERLRAYYEAAGLEILSTECDAEAADSGARGINEQPLERIAEMARRALAPGADALFLSCTAWRAFELVEILEAELGVPVVTSNQALAWACLRELSLDTTQSGLGALGRTTAPI